MLTPRLIESALELCKASPRHLFLAYSGGVDSHVLLHLCAQNPGLRERLTAVHVHHGLQSRADSWANHAEQTARGLGVEFVLCRVDAHPKAGESPEEAARNARYEALKSMLRPGDAVLVAQHQDDQLETVLLQLLRGSGLPGLAGMPASMPFGQGTLLRPLLPIRKPLIDRYASTHRLHWVEDPTNNESVYDRNYLRRQVLPLLKQRWPSCDVTVARAAGHCAEAEALLAGLAAEAFAEVYRADDNTLDIEKLNTFEMPRRHLVIRRWFKDMGLKMPSRSFLAELFDSVIDADIDSAPVLCGQSYRVRRYRNRLYCLKGGQDRAFRHADWPQWVDAIRIGDHRVLARVRQAGGIPEPVWRQAEITVKFRSGGEKIALPGRQGHHSLKKLYQEAGIPPWERESMPLIYLDGKLAAVGNLWISAEFYTANESDCIGFAFHRD